MESYIFHLNTAHFFMIQTSHTQTHSFICKENVLLKQSAFTFVRGAGREAASGGDVIIFVLREVVLDFFDQGEACGKGSRG